MEHSISGGQAGGAGDAERGGTEAFGRSRACFEGLITTLADPEGGRLTHAQMEEQLTALSRERWCACCTRTRWTCGRSGRSAAAG